MRLYGKNGKPFLTKDPKLILNDNKCGQKRKGFSS